MELLKGAAWHTSELWLGCPAAITVCCRVLQPRAPKQLMLVGNLVSSSCMELLGCSSCPHEDPSPTSTGMGDSQSCIWNTPCIAQALRFDHFCVHFPQIFQCAGPARLEVGLGLDSHEFHHLPTPPPPTHKAQIFLTAVGARAGVRPVTQLPSEKSPCSSRAGKAVIHTKSRIMSKCKLKQQQQQNWRKQHK